MTKPPLTVQNCPLSQTQDCRTLHRLPYEEEAHVRPDICE